MIIWARKQCKNGLEYWQDNMDIQLNTIKQSKRIYILSLQQEVIDKYLGAVKNISLSDIDYIPYFRFLMAKEFELLFHLQAMLLNILKDYEHGGIMIHCGDLSESNYIKMSTAVSYLLGHPDIDPLSGKHYAIFTVKHTDNQVPNLFRPYEQFKMHTDGAYMNKVPDWIFFMKMDEIAVAGGRTRLLHIADWEEYEQFYKMMDKKVFRFFSTPSSSKSSSRYQCGNEDSIYAMFLETKDKEKSIRFVDRFVYPHNIEEAEQIYQIQHSLESSNHILEIDIPIGSILLINNRFWLHGRMKFQKNSALSRTLMRQRGSFHANDATLY